MSEQPTWYGVTYWRYYHKYFETDSDIDYLVGFAEGMSDEGECGSREYWLLRNGEWVPFDASDLVKAREERSYALIRQQIEQERERQWLVVVRGPNRTLDEVSSHVTREEAETAAASPKLAGLPVEVRRK